MCNKTTSLTDWENELRNALNKEQFEVHYQPVVDLNSGIPTGFEALVRWNHPTLGLVSPAEFLMIAEETNLIVPIGNWVLRTACRQVREWADKLNPPSGLTIGVNLSAKQFRHPGLPETIEAILAETDLPASCLILEISERNLMRDAELSIAVMQRLVSIGIRLAMDDFGLGYSSLGTLNRLPLDILKLDRPFVIQMETQADSLRVASTIVNLTARLGIKTIAEGVETMTQTEMLRGINCRAAQGYYYSKPLAANHAESWISNRLKEAGILFREGPISLYEAHILSNESRISSQHGHISL